MAATTISTALLLLLSLLTSTTAQTRRRNTTVVAPAPPPASDTCNGIWITYTYDSGKKLHPIRSQSSKQPYSFKSELTILNNDDVELKSWQVLVGFQHGEILVSADGAILANGSTLPGQVGEGTILAGYPNSDLKTGIQTAGDLTQMSTTVKMMGTQFGVGPPGVPLPSNVSLVNDGYSCPSPSKIGILSLSPLFLSLPPLSLSVNGILT